MMKYVPGVIGAVAAYGALMFINWIQTSWVHAAIFFGVYLFVTLGVDKAMTQYGNSAGKK